mmetsp:Transcript_5402/g.16540  ORF Transcript_5402/g.16540 Transcript_5402/m.16540 type:complete len:118 (-) Transcript_5402:906-1259(-)
MLEALAERLPLTFRFRAAAQRDAYVLEDGWVSGAAVLANHARGPEPISLAHFKGPSGRLDADARLHREGGTVIHGAKDEMLGEYPLVHDEAEGVAFVYGPVQPLGLGVAHRQVPPPY